MMLKLAVRAQMFAADRIAWMRSREREWGASALEWVLISAIAVAIVAVAYAAINGKVLEKINIIKNA